MTPLLYALLLPAAAALLIPACRRSPNLREAVTLAAAAGLFAIVLSLSRDALEAPYPTLVLGEIMPGLELKLELEPLGRDDFVRILSEPKNALIKQYTALMETEGLTLRFTDGAIERVADFATLVNERTENIGARRLHTVMEKLLDEISFEAPDMTVKSLTIDDEYVQRMLAEIVKNEDLSRYIL